MKLIFSVFVFLLWYAACNQDTRGIVAAQKEKINYNPIIQEGIDAGTAQAPNVAVNVRADSIVAFAKTLIGIPYKYGSVDVAEGFDCSGFITYVFSHFKIAVPRSSVDFTHAGVEINLPDARPGDLILFTGTNADIRIVGHMGIVTGNADSLRFIHSTSGKKYGVTVTPLNKYYAERLVKVIRIV
jgi:cell wall-associated NlpC family hydrolase